MMRISNALRKHGYKISFAKMISDPYVKHWWDNADINVKRKSVPPLETSNNSPKQFPLTDVQYAYWVGRKEGQVLGGNACHAYFEFDPDTVNLERLQVAWEELQMRHPMLRAKFNNNGTQEIMENHIRQNYKSMILENQMILNMICWLFGKNFLIGSWILLMDK